jgi:predicted Ser/Thr protein kinase
MAGLIGKTLGSYRVIAQIGMGGMAKIYQAYQPSMERTVALKVLPEHYAEDPQFVERFYREARTIAQLEHPNILPVYDFGEQDGITYLVMRFLDGGTLQDWIGAQRLGLHQSLEIVIQVCAALDYAHRKGIIHRDVKPSNVLIDREGAVYLSDFGIAKVLESSSRLTQTGTAMGTPAYMSPEQCRGETVDRRSDIYSLGVVLYELAVGRVPFQANTPVAVLFAHLHEPLPLPRSLNPAISEALQNVILKALAKNPADRYQTAAEMGAALRRALPPAEAPLPEPEQSPETLPAAPLPAESRLETQGPESQAQAAEAAPAEATALAEPDGEIAEPVSGEQLHPAELAPEPPARRTIVVEAEAREKEAASGVAPRPGKSRRGWLAAALGLGLVALLATGVILTRGRFSASSEREPESTTQAIAATAIQFILPAPTLPPSPLPTSTPWPTPTRRPTLTPQPAPTLLNLQPLGLWADSVQAGCQVELLEDGIAISNPPRPDLLDCSNRLDIPDRRGYELPSMEISMRVEPPFAGDGQRTALAWMANIPQVGDSPPGSWMVKCGVVKEQDLTVSLWIQDTRMGQEAAQQSVYSGALELRPEEWARLRLQVEPDTMTFSCWMNDQLVGMYNPVSEQGTLKAAAFTPYLLVIRPPQSKMSVALRELVSLPPRLVRRAAEGARPPDGCLPPPPGIIAWWTGDGVSESLVFPGRGWAEGAWGFAKGMVGQAFAIQNFPSRPGGLFSEPAPQLQNLEAVTVEGWALIEAGPFHRIDRFLTLGMETLVIRHDGYETPGTLHFYMSIDGKLQHLWSQRLMKAGMFNHVAGSYDGATMKLYLNGVLLKSTSVKGKIDVAANVVLGGGNETIAGLLDEFTLYNRALSEQEIRAIFQAGAAGKCRP